MGKMNFIVSYNTDKGIRKLTNQDALLMKVSNTPNGRVGLFVVCDGMGGLEQGELASATVIRGLDKWYEEEFEGLLKIGSNLIPFENHFPKDLELYKLMSTNPKDK